MFRTLHVGRSSLVYPRPVRRHLGTALKARGRDKNNTSNTRRILPLITQSHQSTGSDQGQDKRGLSRRSAYEYLVQYFYSAIWNRFDARPSTIAANIAATVKFRGSLEPQTTDLDGFVRYVEGIRASFPDFYQRIDELYVDDEADTCIAKLFWSGTHTGNFRGVAPTGRRFAYPGVGVFKFESLEFGGNPGERQQNWRISEVWAMGDTHAVWQVIEDGGEEIISDSDWEGRKKGGLEDKWMTMSRP